MCYELHYRGFASVDPDWEWNPTLLAFRAELERAFLAGVRRDVGPIEPGHTAAAEMDAIAVEPKDGSGPSYFLRDHGTWEQMREYFVHRSLYHLKEADPHAFAIPRLTGTAKAAFVAVEFDEYGAGQGRRMHQQSLADLMDAADLDSTYLRYLDVVPAETLAAVNLMSLFGLHRKPAARPLGISLPPRSPHRRAHGGWCRRCSGCRPPRRASSSTASTWRPTRYTNTWYAETWWAIW